MTLAELFSLFPWPLRCTFYFGLCCSQCGTTFLLLIRFPLHLNKRALPCPNRHASGAFECMVSSEMGTGVGRMKRHYYFRLISICRVLNGIVCPSFPLSLLLLNPSLCRASADPLTEVSWLQIKCILKIPLLLMRLCLQAGGGRQLVACGRWDKVGFRLLLKKQPESEQLHLPSGQPLLSCSIRLFSPLWVPPSPSHWVAATF